MKALWEELLLSSFFLSFLVALQIYNSLYIWDIQEEEEEEEDLGIESGAEPSSSERLR